MSLWLKSWSVIIQMKATEQNFPVELLTMLHKAVLTSKFVHEILLFDHLNES